MTRSAPIHPQLFTRMLIARHGEVDEHWRRTVYGRLDVELSSVGLEQSRRLGEELSETPIDAVVSSGLRRAEAAAAQVRSRRPGPDLGRVDDERFVEMDRGVWAGRTVDDLEANEPDAYARWMACRGAVQAPGGESPDDVAARVLPAYGDWARRFPGGTVLVVAHLWVVRSAVAAALGVPMERSGQLSLPPGGICDFLWPVSIGDSDPSSEPPILRSFGLARG
ncbi:Phosphoserine phosphatase 1 [Planctomycetes bacterium Poly30]|uniref:Phosphoserine phosphatase 1 n=1 Tax=Saltatorellus ferox TaxID=2528018 RepID=A0A518ETE9_9BACT|nr:Phosphoserine phosphatase 1 [Planctomycetes bacterium Poly30]